MNDLNFDSLVAELLKEENGQFVVDLSIYFSENTQGNKGDLLEQEEENEKKYKES
ncbi:hypothetical protein [Enterococcus faecium]|uniref:hypothetical protein n=1 Tax=Enterococcus faecium TaxID=1352 RepID=UPI0022F14C60|nr:hypothetical protein [Enterococcus faecium]MDQ8526876.1 hypothetical protein [Enterococcus faecium]MDT6277434.1 hypothetical protein [Enterococcus faecium]